MKKQITGGLAAVVLAVGGSAALAQGTPAAAPAAKDAGAATRKQNLDQEIRMLRKDVRADKAKVIGTAMQLDADQSTKFWPIYKEYETQLTKLNDMREANIREYAKNYANMSDNKADELVNAAIAYHKKRIDLLANTYDKVRSALGSPIAARFVQAENELLNIIDLQIESSLPLIWGSGDSVAK
ncbi:MAG TPA: hypothetical protein VGP32_05585 [Steroidobacteraceae bacterium]|jgi:hypothetical protein|nr:hypothetical protein [Steroidobacteraceae bacterium]